jgi:hypothetical protein
MVGKWNGLVVKIQQKMMWAMAEAELRTFGVVEEEMVWGMQHRQDVLLQVS